MELPLPFSPGQAVLAPIAQPGGDVEVLRARFVERVGSCGLVRTADLRSAGREVLVFLDEIQAEPSDLVEVVSHRSGSVSFEA